MMKKMNANRLNRKRIRHVLLSALSSGFLAFSVLSAASLSLSVPSAASPGLTILSAFDQNLFSPVQVYASETSGDAPGGTSGGNPGDAPDGTSGGNSEGTSEGSNASDGSGMYSKDYYRAVDTSGQLSDSEQQALDRHCIEFMEANHADLSLLAVTSDVYKGATLSELARGYYEDCGFGYGPGKDGFQVVWDMDTDEVLIEAYGSAQGLIPQDYLNHVTEEVTKFRENYGIYGPLYASTRYLSNYLSGSGSSFGSSGAAGEAGADGAAGEAGAAGGAGADGAAGGACADGAAGGEAADAETGGKGSGNTSDSNAAVAAGQSGEETAQAAAADARQVRSADGEGSDDLQLLSPGEAPEEFSLEADHEILPDGQKPDAFLRVGEGSDMPAWYPKDTNTFPFYHDADAPRVVDQADIFTDEEEAQMEERLAQLRGQLAKDIVIFTDVSTHGLSHTAYADDFFDYNGYGIGEDFEGVCLMVCMDPDDRGWWTSCSGPVTMGLYTETVANQIDDLLYEYMVAGDYGEGVADWIENFRRLYTTGSPYSEEWALLSKDSFERFHDESAPRVIDDANILTTGEIEQLTAKAASLAEKYDVDVVVHTVLNEGILDRDEYGDLFCYFNGYGYGDNYDSICLTIFKRPNYSGEVKVNASGKGLDKLSDVNRSRLEGRCEDIVLGRDYYTAADQWLDQTGHMLRTGRAPRSVISWHFFTAIEFLIGIIFGGVSLSRAKARMATPEIRENADAYLVPGSLHVRKVADDLVDKTVSRTYSPPPKETRSSGGSSSSGRSSYSSSHHSSSGRTHSGSGRRF